MTWDCERKRKREKGGRSECGGRRAREKVRTERRGRERKVCV